MNWRLFAMILGAVGVVLIGLAIVGANPVDSARALYGGALGSDIAFRDTVKEMTPLLIAGLAVFVGLRAGLFNIGVEGQLIVGALCCAETALYVQGVPGIVAGLLAGMAGGAVWALPAGLIKAYRNGHEVITTIMFNQMAKIFTLALVAGPLRSPGAQSAITPNISDSTTIGTALTVERFQMSWALPIGLVLVLGIWIWLKRTVSGYEFQAVGANPAAARLAGVSPARVTVAAMAASGAIAGLAGALLVLAVHHHFSEAFFASYGFTALGVALLAGAAPWALIASAFLFAVLNQGALDLQDDVPKGLIGVIVGLLLIIFAAIRYRRVSASA